MNLYRRGLVGSLAAVTLLFAFQSYSQTPKREFRAAWVASVTNLDWPTTPDVSASFQQTQLVTLLDSLKNAGFNAVLLQIRAEGDALYASPHEPWSYWLTGAQGREPIPYYDPLEFAVDEAHKRGMELHAWFNPYRSVQLAGRYTPAENHVSVVHPEWNIQIGTFKFLNPGLPQVREYVTDVVMDVVNRYDIDGVHFDDYFYPYSGITFQDTATFSSHSRGISNIADWRRDNVNLLVAQVHDSIQAVKPFIKFGISPFGIWRHGYPSIAQTTLDAYEEIYCDAIAWLQRGSVDYLTPQLYWGIGTTQTDYSILMTWWADSVAANSRHFYPGHIFGSSYSVSELPAQLRLDRQNPKTHGSVFFRASHIRVNEKGFSDSLKLNYYRHPAVFPRMDWKDTLQPNAPLNVRYQSDSSGGPAHLAWDVPSPATDGDTASRYVVYRFPSMMPDPSEYETPASIVSVEGLTKTSPPIPSVPGTYYFSITALDRNANEGPATVPVAVSPPPAPVPAVPADDSLGLPPEITLTWNESALSSQYTIQLDEDSVFSPPLAQQLTAVGLAASISGLEGQHEYFWRVRSGNAGGYSEYSRARSFTTGFPSTPVPAIPANASANITPEEVMLAWQHAGGAQSYRLQVSTSSNFSLTTIDTSGVPDTSYALSNLEGFKIYFWRLSGTNAVGTSLWSETFRFRTSPVSFVDGPGVPLSFNLAQNFPNPFNAETHIRFTLAETGVTTLKVYDVLGREIAVLWDGSLGPGEHSAQFGTAAIPSGTYVYVLTSAGKRLSRKMLVVK